MASQDLERILDDALAAFDDDDAPPAAAPPAARVSPGAQPDSTSAAAVDASSSGGPAGEAEATGAHERQAGDEPGPSSKEEASSSRRASWGSTLGTESKPFDPLGAKRRPKKAPGGAPAGLGGGPGLGSAPVGLGGAAGLGGGGARRRGVRPEAAGLEDDLVKLVAEWQQDGDSAGAAGPGPLSAAAAPSAQQQQRPRPGSAVLRALEEQTRRTVADQAARLNPGGVGGSDDDTGGGSEGGDGGGSGDHVSQIMDVVMQHLLSKDVLYQPMMEIRDKYPPWLEAHRTTAPPADVARYEAQYAAICRLVEAYERTPGDFARIMTLLQEMQACGEPPPEIVDDMSSAIGAELPPGFGSGGGDVGGEDMDLPPELLRALPDNMRGCPMQ